MNSIVIIVSTPAHVLGVVPKDSEQQVVYAHHTTLWGYAYGELVVGEHEETIASRV
jgi:hypothetical protein